ncbi:hypothetical protein PC116_g8125 [Phytophthora cactorum]|nr:hypothetical protein PC114_g3526 [Phytophthora cactorum]KAG3190699.1 hypothetical protein PC128_g11193 [Phytophthora cactorum]KAG4243996.1 hypothetical protein PC116_g8125 [Phytophthora cactorum]
MEMIASLTQKVEAPSARISCPEETGHHQQAPNKETLAVPAAPPQARSSTASSRRNSGAKSLSSVWYEWFAATTPFEAVIPRSQSGGDLL